VLVGAVGADTGAAVDTQGQGRAASAADAAVLALGAGTAQLLGSEAAYVAEATLILPDRPKALLSHIALAPLVGQREATANAAITRDPDRPDAREASEPTGGHHAGRGAKEGIVFAHIAQVARDEGA